MALLFVILVGFITLLWWASQQKIASVDTCRGGVCWMWEDVAADVSREYLEKHQQDGLRLQVSGKAGKVVVTVPAGYVRAFLERVPE